MKDMEKIINYWYKIDNVQDFNIQRYAKNIKQAWEKTFVKWYLISLFPGKVPYTLLVSRCGLCDIYGGLDGCKVNGGCPIYNDSKKEYCKGVKPYVYLCKDYTKEYTQSELILQQILYLIKVYKDTMK